MVPYIWHEYSFVLRIAGRGGGGGVAIFLVYNCMDGQSSLLLISMSSGWLITFINFMWGRQSLFTPNGIDEVIDCPCQH